LSPRAALVLVALLLALLPRAGWASSYTVNPVQVRLPASGHSALVSVRNVSAEPLRLQLNAFRWDESLDGEMRLAPTADVIFFPRLLTVEPGGERRIRIAVGRSAGATEQTYRLFLEELPDRTGSATTGDPGVRVLTRTGIPIFVAPRGAAKVEGKVETMALRAGTASFLVRNTGNAHFMVTSITLTGLDSHGSPLFRHEIPGWYVLANAARRYALDVPPAACPQLRALVVDARTSHAMLTGRLPREAAGCSD
jgi:fimbrial chaperone protein